MKKYLFMAIAAVTALAFSSCKDETDTPTTDLVVTVSPKTLELAVGDEIKIRATVTPAGSDVKVTYTSDNEAVATVTAAGLVTGIEEGTANIIVSAQGAKSDTCVVTVVSAEDAFKWAGWTIWNVDKTNILSHDTAEVTLKSGQVVHCVMVPATARVWSDGIVFDDAAGNNAGIGYISFIDTVPVYLITEALDDKGTNYYYVGSSTLYFVDDFNANDTAYAYCAKAGKPGDAAVQLEFMDGDGKDEGIDGASIWYLDCATFQGYPTVGMIGRSLFYGDETSTYYKSNVGWFENVGGLKYNSDSTAHLAEWCDIESKYYENWPATTSAKKYFIIDPAKMQNRENLNPTRSLDKVTLHMAK